MIVRLLSLVSDAAPTSREASATIRDASGATIGSGLVTLQGNGHSSFTLTDNFPATANQRGTIEFDPPAQGQISVLGVRFPSTGSFTSIPVVAP